MAYCFDFVSAATPITIFNLINSNFQPTESLMSFEGQQCQGAQKILEKFQVFIDVLDNLFNFVSA